MKVVFVGPTLRSTDFHVLKGCVETAPPARQGDMAGAVARGANVIGLVDGIYENVPSVWHKEILYALSRGVRVFGAASMGALRAAECAAFGMVGVGEIFDDYHTGKRDDDGDVAQLHAPAELGYRPLTVPLVNVDATLRALSSSGKITLAERSALEHAAHALFFKDRTYGSVADAAVPTDAARRRRIKELLRTFAIDRKREDALLLLSAILAEDDERRPPPKDWTIALTHAWTWVLPGSSA